MKILNSKQSKFLLIFGLLLIIAIALFIFLSPGFDNEPWKMVSPEKQGFKSITFHQMLSDISSNQHDIHELLIMRNSQIVLEQYLPPYNESTLHSFKSITKSITSAIVGIAISEGKLTLETTVYEVFPEAFENTDDLRKKEITLRDLLTMTPGFDLTDDDIAANPEIVEYITSDEWIKKYMQHPLAFNPGEKFRYFTGTTNLLTAVLTEKIGMDLEKYAAEKLFTPLGIQNIYWQRGPKGYLRGGSGIYSTPREIAKIALLFMNGGKYDGKQIIEKSWIKESTTNQIGAEYADQGNQTGMKYGYQWWIPTPGVFMGLGWGGQHLYVDPKLDLVVIETGSDFFETGIIENYIYPALQSFYEPLKESPEDYRKLQLLSDELENPMPNTELYFPEIAGLIFGKEFICTGGENNEVIKFETGSQAGNMEEISEIIMHRTYTLRDEEQHTIELTIGLDGIFRYSKIRVQDLYFEDNAMDFNDDFIEIDFAAKGEWTDEKTLSIQIHEVGAPVYESWKTVFNNENSINYDIDYIPTGFQRSLEGKVKE